MTQDLTVYAPNAPSQFGSAGQLALPVLIRDAGDSASRAFLEFFAASIRNRNTREAYARACGRFLDWCHGCGLTLAGIQPLIVATYIESLEARQSVASIKLEMAAIRMMFDALAEKQVITGNPARSVRGPKHAIIEGATPAFAVPQAQALLKSIDTTNVIGLRDRALLSTLIYTGARVSAVCQLQVRDFQLDGAGRTFRFREKGGKQRKIPCRHDLAAMMEAYLAAAGIGGESDTPLFRSVDRRRHITARGLHRVEVHEMLKRRLKAAGLPANLSSHSFRATTATDLLAQGVPLEDVQYLLGHADPRTTRLYDRRRKEVTRNIVERLSV